MGDHPSVTDLVTRARNGDKQAWDAIVERYAALVWAICRSQRLDDADAHDVEPARTCVDGTGDQYRLAGYGNAEVLQHDQQGDRPDAEVLKG